MKNLITLFIIVIISIQFSTAQEIGKITKSDCFSKNSSPLDKGANIEFGYITVPADYSNPKMKTYYQLAFMVVKARNNNSK